MGALRQPARKPPFPRLYDPEAEPKTESEMTLQTERDFDMPPPVPEEQTVPQKWQELAGKLERTRNFLAFTLGISLAATSPTVDAPTAAT